MSRNREIRDPIHGFIERSKLEQELIDTKVFQRLRGIKQLAMANLVYPGALHTRFDHSIGVMHVAGNMAEKLEVEEEKRQNVKLAALLHDIGHGPFSHVSEELLDKYYDSTRVKPGNHEKIHELLTCQIIDQNRELDIRDEDRKKIIGLISGTQDEPIIRGIISGPLDADKLDYLLRDSYFCGVKYGVYDIDRLIGTLFPYREESSGDTILAVTYDGVYAIEQYVIAKYHLSTQVYRHKIRLITDSMIVRALELGIEQDKLQWLIDLYSYDGSNEYINNYIKWDDCRVINELLRNRSASKMKSAQLFNRLIERCLLKRVFSKPIRLIKNPDVRDFLVNVNKEKKFKKELEINIASILSEKTHESVDPDYVIVYSFTIKSVRVQSRNDEGSIMIFNEGIIGRFENESTLFRSIDERENEQLLEVYAPVRIEDETKKRKIMKELNNEIHDLVEKESLTELKKRRRVSNTVSKKKRRKK